MGMAASQARLLCITARIHDVEYQAQAIQAAKVQLATQEDRVYQDYLDALDASTLTISSIDTNSGTTSTVAATFNNLCSSRHLTPSDGSTYAIRNSQGLLLVEDEIEEGYYNYTNNNLSDPYQFALYMMNEGNINGISDIETYDIAMNEAEEKVYSSLTDAQKSSRLTTLHDKLQTLTKTTDIYDTSSLSEDDESEYDKTLTAYKKELYKTNAPAIQIAAEPNSIETEDFNYSLFNYYVNIFNQIKSCGGCVSIEDYEGDAANNSEWLKNMVQSGQFTIELVNTDSTSGEVTMNPTSPSSDTCLSYTTTSTIDNRALAKAEAEYNQKLKQIDKTDKKYDLELSKLETERTALTTEYESVKKVIEDNIDRTFGIFS